ncbi:hypothetical protein EOL96_05525 [Candidatus Saccharibacteria bacterium]|nr:hypothetical protein [Candidatus Saccharibacteria bacterium]
MITKAIIPVAGWGTRRLPITKSIEKCMLPVGNRPVVDYIVQDCIAAGITDIYFVVSERSEQVRDFYRTNIDLNDYLKRSGKTDTLSIVSPPKVSLHYVVQSSYGKYGTAIPPSLVFRELAEGEPVIVVGGDDFIYNPKGESSVRRLIEAVTDTGGAIYGAPVEGDISRYGVIAMDEKGSFEGIVEKPQPGEEPSHLINISQYALPYEAMRAIYEYAKTEKSGEYLITDAVNRYVAQGGKMKVVETDGAYLDCGTVEGWLMANQVVLG